MLDFLVGNDALSAIVAFALVLIPAILIHEIGHFLAAKAVGITILEFGIGFPPRMLTLFRRGETEYTLNWLPIGGFVRPLGEDFVRPVSNEELRRDRQQLQERLGEQPDTHDSFDTFSGERARLRAQGAKKITSVNEAKPLARILFLIGGSSANLLTAIILFTIIGLSGLPMIVGGSAGIVALNSDSPLLNLGLQEGDLIAQVNSEYFENASEMMGKLNGQIGQPVTLTVQRGEETLEIAYTPVSAPQLESYVFVSGVAPESPAAGAGIEVDDLIVALNGQPFSEFDDLPRRTQENLGQEITLTLLNDGELRDIQVTPRTNPPEGQGAIGIGIVPAYNDVTSGAVFVEAGAQQAIVPLNPGEAIQFSFTQIGSFFTTLISLPGQLIAGELSSEEARVMSPLAISQFGGLFLQRSIEQNQPVMILNYIAIISIALGITNLLPLPALDGGRIVFVLLEIVRGRPIAPERESIVHLIGMALLLSLMVFAFLNDILNPVTNLIP
jgi:regulator of sigma E protease